ncbi:hypothetical protein [Bacteriovorax sp. Seq25_V]|uniref:hypothetical protein n=1 Tax=Bacteriovorax sp. Seq25_V TaxID=1201288 RepID=UPI0018DEFA14|nr:hypothetical protein [Bacteriovorax sp. Seq25_V]
MFILNFALFLASCSTITSSAPDSKDDKLKVNPGINWKSINSDQADYAYSSSNSDNILFINSLCKKYENSSIKNLMYSLLGNTDYKILNEKNLTLFNRETMSYEIETKVDGVKTYLNIVLLKKDRCIYDFVLINPKEKSDSNTLDEFYEIVKASSL